MDFKKVIEKLDGLADQVAPVLLEEANPDNWAGAGKKVTQMTKQERGDRFWDKKNATSTAILLMKIHGVIDLIEDAEKGRKRRNGARVEVHELEEEILKVQREAKLVMSRVQKH